jgi:hypothetical protein
VRQPSPKIAIRTGPLSVEGADRVDIATGFDEFIVPRFLKDTVVIKIF